MSKGDWRWARENERERTEKIKNKQYANMMELKNIFIYKFYQFKQKSRIFNGVTRVGINDFKYYSEFDSIATY